MSEAENDSTPDEDVEALREELAEQRDALENLTAVLEPLDQSGALDVLAAVGTRDQKSNEQFYEAFADDPANLRAVQNLSLLGGGLSQIDPDALAAILNGDGVTAEEFADPPEMGLRDVIQKLRDPDVRRGLGIVFLLLKQLGSTARTPITETRDR